ncbi:MAG: adenosylcobinamide-GDP ribazoletransferase [Gaiellales bacterium]|nr:MAG: adenosylcobinamide-GDP ribazoletransferase [Gaiellales bacterium]
MRQLRVAFSFFTIIPLASPASIVEVARACFLAPVVGAAVGAIAGLAGWGAEDLFDAPVAAALALCASLLVTGLHHADGLADLGDALMARGGRRRRVEVLKDRTLGVGAAGALVMTYLVSWAALLELIQAVEGPAFVLCMVSVELSTRMALLVNAAISPSSHEGSGSAFLEAARGWRGFTGVILTLAALAAAALALGYTATVAAAAAALLTAALLSLVGRRLFGGVGGDILGATVELARMAALLALAAAVIASPPV